MEESPLSWVGLSEGPGRVDGIWPGCWIDAGCLAGLGEDCLLGGLHDDGEFAIWDLM